MRTKVTELGELKFMDDGGLVCAVTLPDAPSLDASILTASRYWREPESVEFTVGDFVLHPHYGGAHYRGSKNFNIAGRSCNCVMLEFAGGDRLVVPPEDSCWLQKLDIADGQPRKLGSLRTNGSRYYWLEVLPYAYEWPGIGTFPKLPRKPTPAEDAQWRAACVIYRKALHSHPSYLQQARAYLEQQGREPQPLFDWWAYREKVLRVEPTESPFVYNRDEQLLLIKRYVLRRQRAIEKIQREVETLENFRTSEHGREPIPNSVRLFVWQRDKGQCIRCGSRERLEFDHIIPITAGGSNTERNIQLLCEPCNRSKGSSI